WAPDFSDSQDDSSESDNKFVDDKSKDGYTEKVSEAEEIPDTVFEAEEPGEIKGSVTKELIIRNSIGDWNGDVIIMGDFNEVRFVAERFGSIFNARGAAVFNSFISSSGLVEVASGGYSFTWAHKSATKMSKLDRFLISEALMRNCPNISSITLDRFLSDHRPILLREICLDYGPTPFRFFHHWFGFIGFDSFVFESWKDIQIQDQNVMLNFAKKLKVLKGRIRSWVKDKKEKAHVLKNSLKKKLADIDSIVDK
ncbi:RNA-directed DNA polymerase, eukaryota, partial [Tanacetum coccineum]